MPGAKRCRDLIIMRHANIGRHYDGTMAWKPIVLVPVGSFPVHLAVLRPHVVRPLDHGILAIANSCRWFRPDGVGGVVGTRSPPKHRRKRKQGNNRQERIRISYRVAVEHRETAHSTVSQRAQVASPQQSLPVRLLELLHHGSNEKRIVEGAPCDLCTHR